VTQAEELRLAEHCPSDFARATALLKGWSSRLSRHADRHLILFLGSAVMAFDQLKTIFRVHFGVRRHAFEQKKTFS